MLLVWFLFQARLIVVGGLVGGVAEFVRGRGEGRCGISCVFYPTYLPTYHLTNRFVARYSRIYSALQIPQAPAQLYPAAFTDRHDRADQLGSHTRGVAHWWMRRVVVEVARR
jgi:hypothetical protein